MMKKTLLVILLLGVLVSACSSGAPQTASTQAVAQPTSPSTPTAIPDTPTIPPTQTSTSLPTEPPATPTTPATPTPYVVGPVDFPDAVNPLTGLPVSDPNNLNRRPMAVKVQLYPRGQRPVWGVSQADIVYDYYQNNGLTRLNAIFYGSNADQIGPIRSARLFDESIIRMYDALFAFGGAASYVLNRFNNAEYSDRLVTEGRGRCPPMCRIDPNGFNFLVTSSPELTLYALREGIDNARQDLDGMSFSSNPPAGGEAGQQLYTRYSISAYNRWDYDPASGKYLRNQDIQEDNSEQDEAFAPLIDGMTGQTITADNVIVLFLPHQPAEAAGTRNAVDISLSGSGDAIAFRDGQAYKVRWNRPTKDSALFLTSADGEFFPFKPGNTWFQVVGISTQVENPESGVWRFESQFP